MHFSIDFNTLLTTLVGIGVVKGVLGIIAIDRKITSQNNRIGKIETWRDEHVKLNDDRYKTIISGMAGLREDIHNAMAQWLNK